MNISSLELTGYNNIESIEGTPLTAEISGASSKSRYPRSSVQILFCDEYGKKAEVRWWIEKGQIEIKDFRPIAGRRYDQELSEYLEEELSGWEVQLVSINSTKSNGSPSAVTIRVRSI